MGSSKNSYFFEVSWEVCNMVGGIYTVLATKASEMKKKYGDNYITIGPNVPHPLSDSPSFNEEIWDEAFYASLQELSSLGVLVRMGRWLIPGAPKCLLLSSRRLNEQRDRILAHYWESFQINSLFGSWDYIEPVLFSHAAGLVIERLFSDHILMQKVPCIVQAHEWMTGVSLLHLKERSPEIATVFTTHATILGRSLSSQTTDELLLTRLRQGHPDEMAHHVGITSKHSLESTIARTSDVFTTVSKTTSDECEAIFGRKPEVLVLNAMGEEVPSPTLLEPEVKARAKKKLLDIATAVTGTGYKASETITIITSGRYEYMNKGIDIFMGALGELQHQQLQIPLDKRVVAFVICPRDHGRFQVYNGRPLISSHEITDENNDPVMRAARDWGLNNDPNSRVHFVFIPIYLNGQDGGLPYQYYDILTGADLSCFPSWYEPWGYTPLEAIALGVPTVTSDLAGFGQWAKDFGNWNTTGVRVLERTTTGSSKIQSDLAIQMLSFSQLGSAERADLSAKALALSQKARWKHFAKYYFQAHEMAIEKSRKRIQSPDYDKFRSFSVGESSVPTEHSHARAHIRHFQVRSRGTEILSSLLKVSGENIWWIWNPKLYRLFANWNEQLWYEVKQNPRSFLERVDENMIAQLLLYPDLKKLLEDVQHEFAEISSRALNPEIAYFCMEYGLVDQLRIYSGGLGMLAGDHLKAAADVKLPLVAFGLFYRYGYFRQGISPEGAQEAIFHRVDHIKTPLEPVGDGNGGAKMFSVPCGEKAIYFKAWKLNLGGVCLYLLDTDVSNNSMEWRLVTDRLYPSDQEKRILQEWVLSLGGLEVLKYLNMQPHVYHMNEGHTAFLTLGRMAQLMKQQSLSFDAAQMFVRHTTVFTTHTPVAAGHDQFPEEMVAKILVPYLKSHQFSDELVLRTLGLGRSIGMGPTALFSMTGLAIRGSLYVNGVSRIHGGVSQKMFNSIFPELDPNEVPVTSVTNGVHLRSWIAPMWQNLFFNLMGEDWYNQVKNVNYWDKFHYLPAEKIWDTKAALKRQLIDWIRNYIRQNLKQEQKSRPELSAVLGTLSEDTLIITHAKRMAPYKRADILFNNKERLTKVLGGNQPILLIYAGKSHPSDGIGQSLIHKINSYAKQPEYLGKILFIENYDLEFAQTLIAGSDLWINTPIRPLEACGTSGMKAGVNGTLNFAVADGWWPEYYNGRNGWMIGNETDIFRDELQNGLDANSIFSLLESEIIPMYRDRDEKGVPQRWVQRIKESIGSLIPRVAAERMLDDYQGKLYNPAIANYRELSANHYEGLKQMMVDKENLIRHWEAVRFVDVNVATPDRGSWMVGDNLEVHVSLHHKGLTEDSLEVHLMIESTTPGHEVGQKIDTYKLAQLEKTEKVADGDSYWVAAVPINEVGPHSMSVRVQPKGFKLLRPLDMNLNLTKWL